MKVLKQKTTWAGIATLVAVTVNAIADPSSLGKAETIPTIISAIGLLFAGDHIPTPPK